MGDGRAGRCGAFLRRLPRSLRYIVPGGLVVFVLVLEIYSRSAAWLFNKAMAEQEMMAGTITAERILASPLGYVAFEDLEWKDPNGQRILYIPDGSFTVDIADTLLQHFTSTTIEKLTVNHAHLALRLDEDMSVEFVRTPGANERPPQKKKELKGRDEDKTEAQLIAEGEERRRRQRERWEKDWTNFNHEGKHLDTHIFLNDCRLEVFYRERHYLLEAVRLDLNLDTKGNTTLKLATGPFGGTMIGSGLFLNGKIDFRQKIPGCDLSLLLDEVDPSSLGFGMDVHDPLSMAVRFEGDIVRPVGKGTLHFDRLRIPALDFQDVDGDIDYADALLRFTDVHASVYGGSLDAEGWYNLDTRYYHIEGKGEKLRAKKALPDAGLRCLVDLDIRVDSLGNAQRTSYGGKFVSGKGRYQWIPFKSLQGSFHSLARELNFYDVKIDFGGLIADTDAFNIINGKLTLQPIRLTDKRGNLLAVYDPDSKELLDGRENKKF
ncbi:MAG: hypothetical protein IJ812_07460 [Schwartzia sp.]|nr:hypothetical protein [Schwartzia sp. (in: firmicutes)]